MIFNESSYTSNNTVVAESPYELGIEGALMHVYETECNYNALMKAAALSEMKYYTETGKDLFAVNEAAFSGFLEKAKTMFKKIIEKIKSIGAKFMAKINQFTLSNKAFAKKYRNELMRKTIGDFEYEAYEFNTDFEINTLKDTEAASGIGSKADSDEINDKVETNRGKMLKKSGKFSESEYRDELHEELYGDKITYDEKNIKISLWLNYLENVDKDVKTIKREEKEIVRSVEDIIKTLDKSIDTVIKTKKVNNGTEQSDENVNSTATMKSNQIKVWKDYSNDLTIYFGMKTKAMIDRANAIKAGCVKFLSYKSKNESATYVDENDIFAGVNIL